MTTLAEQEAADTLERASGVMAKADHAIARLRQQNADLLEALEANRKLLDNWAFPGNKVLTGEMRRIALTAAEDTQAAIDKAKQD